MHCKLGTVTCILGIFLVGCAKRIAVYDEARNPITEPEIQQHQTNNNFILYTFGGGALSFGASFFLGTIIERSINDSENNVALWATTGAGTLIGTLVFAKQGKIRDRNQAIEIIKEKRKIKAVKKLRKVLTKQQKVEEEKKALERIRQQQNAEKKKLLDDIKKRKDNPDRNE